MWLRSNSASGKSNGATRAFLSTAKKLCSAAAAKKGAALERTNWLKEINAQSTTLSTVDRYRDAKYNNTPEYQLLRGYAKAVQQGEISPLVGFDHFVEVNEAVTQKIIGQPTATGVLIQSATPHFVARIIGQVSTSHAGKRLGVSIQDALDALQNPLKIGLIRILVDGDTRQTFTGTAATVTISVRDGRLIQTNPKG